MKRSVILLVGGLLASSALSAKAESPTPPPPENSNIDQRLEELDYFAREWTCLNSKQGSSALVFPYRWNITKELNGFWYLGRGETQEGVHTQQDTFGYNTILQKFGRTILGNDSKFANYLSSGWKDDQMTWVGTSSYLAIGQTAKHKMVMTRISDAAFTIEEFRAAEEPDTWEAIATQICAATDSDT